MNSKSQCQVVLAHMKSIGPLTQWGAIKHYRITRLGARIWDLKRQGYRVMSRMVCRKGKKFAQYEMA